MFTVHCTGLLCSSYIYNRDHLVADPAGQEGEGAGVLPDSRAGDAEEKGVCHAGELSLVKYPDTGL